LTVDLAGRAGPLAAALADRYAVERELGAGGMATVYLAEDVRHHFPVEDRQSDVRVMEVTRR
jgi:hypothetical protein